MPTAFLFPGLNALKRRKDRERFLLFPEILKSIQKAQQLLNDEYHLDLVGQQFLYQPEETLYSKGNIAVTAVLNTTIQIGIATQLKQIINPPDWVMAYSQGDIARSVIAGIIDFEQAIKIVYQFFNSVTPIETVGENFGIRSQFRQPFTQNDIDWFLQNSIDISIFTPRYMLCSCSNQNAQKVTQKAEQHNWLISKPFFNYPMHSKLLKPLVGQFSHSAIEPVFKAPHMQVYSTILNKPIKDIQDVKVETRNGIFLPIMWLDSVYKLVKEHKITKVINIGPCRSISLMLRETPVNLKVLEADKLMKNSLISCQSKLT